MSRAVTEGSCTSPIKTGLYLENTEDQQRTDSICILERPQCGEYVGGGQGSWNKALRERLVALFRGEAVRGQRGG